MNFVNFIATKSLAVFSALSVLFISACSSIPDYAPPNQVFCAKYLVYRMCVEDLDVDGMADVMYFEDNREVFMRRPDLPTPAIANYPVHACVQEMDEGLTTASTKLLYVTPDTGYFRRTEIETDLLVQYSRYSGKINACRREKGLLEEESEVDDFIDFDDEFAEY